MIPFILAAVGGYLIYDSTRKAPNPLSNPYNILKDGGIMADGGEVDERLSMLLDELKKQDIYSFITKNINKYAFVYVGTDEQYITNIDIHIDKNGKYQLVIHYADGRDKDKAFEKIEDVLKYLMDNYNLTKTSSVIAFMDSRKSRSSKNEWISPRERVKKYGYEDGGETKAKSRKADFANNNEFKKGGKVKKKWIQDALSGGKNKGALRRIAAKKGLLRGDENLSKTDLKKLQKMGGTTAKRAHLAETLRKFDEGGDV